MKRLLYNFLTILVIALFAASCGELPNPDNGEQNQQNQVDDNGGESGGGSTEDPGNQPGGEGGGQQESQGTGGVVEPTGGSTIYGIVTCEGNGVPGVVVSDGIEVVTTDEYGIYQIPSRKKYRYVWISVPSGYEVPSEGVLPHFWEPLVVGASTPERHDFTLTHTGSDDFTLYVLGDMHLARRTNDLVQFRAFAEDLNATINATEGKEYVITLGDMTWDCYWYVNNFGLGNYLDEVNADFSGIQFWHTMGNHDNDMDRSGDFNKEQPYRDILTPTFYSFNLGLFHVIVMDNIDYTNISAGEGNRKYYAVDITR